PLAGPRRPRGAPPGPLERPRPHAAQAPRQRADRGGLPGGGGAARAERQARGAARGRPGGAAAGAGPERARRLGHLLGHGPLTLLPTQMNHTPGRLVWASGILVQLLYTSQGRDVLASNPPSPSERAPCRQPSPPPRKPKPA